MISWGEDTPLKSQIWKNAPYQQGSFILGDFARKGGGEAMGLVFISLEKRTVRIRLRTLK